MRLRGAPADRAAAWPLGLRLTRDYRFRLICAAGAGLVLNLLYALYHGVLGVLGGSLWLLTMCAYYTILSLVRFAAVLCERKNLAGVEAEYFVMRLAGVLLLALGGVLAAALALSLSRPVAVRHSEILMITIAAYTFCKITLAVLRAAGAKRNPGPLLAVIRSVGYAEIAGSVLTMQRSMLVSFGEMGAGQARVMNTLTGAAVCLFVFGLGAGLTIKGIRGKRDVKWQTQS